MLKDVLKQLETHFSKFYKGPFEIHGKGYAFGISSLIALMLGWVTSLGLAVFFVLKHFSELTLSITP